VGKRGDHDSSNGVGGGGGGGCDGGREKVRGRASS